MEFSRQEYWSGQPFPSLGDLPHPGIESQSPALAGGFFTFWASREVRVNKGAKKIGVVGGGQDTLEEALSGCVFPHHSVGSSLFLCSCVQGLRSKGSSTRGFIPVIQEILTSTMVPSVSQRGSGNPLTIVMCGIDSLVWCFLTLCLTVLMPYKLFFNQSLFMKYKNALLTQWSAF